ncbi:MAG: YecH family protein [Opitutaceae bacterium]|nr:YecH family protein [Opitutaceae bacterium]
MFKRLDDFPRIRFSNKDSSASGNCKVCRCRIGGSPYHNRSRKRKVIDNFGGEARFHECSVSRMETHCCQKHIRIFQTET